MIQGDMMRSFSKRLASAGLLSVLAVLLTGAMASAHVVVKPAEVLTAEFQTFTIGVPNEKEVPTTGVRLVIPDGLKHVSPTQKAGWQIDVAKTGEGEAAKVTEISWSGNAVEAGFREEFTFSAQVPEKVGELQWKAYQTYQNGDVVAWDLAEKDQPKKADGSPDFSKSGPFSVTNVVTETEGQTAVSDVDDAAAEAQATASRSLYIAVGGVLVGLFGVYLALRKK